VMFTQAMAMDQHALHRSLHLGDASLS
jgi:hypothetical protein